MMRYLGVAMVFSSVQIKLFHLSLYNKSLQILLLSFTLIHISIWQVT